MTEVFVIRNQQGHYWGKKKLWVDGGDARVVMRLKHRDEAVNTVFELSSKDIELRAEITAAQLSPKGEPMVTISDTPLPEEPAAEAPAIDPETSEA
mgnify:CR=1 FL=1